MCSTKAHVVPSWGNALFLFLKLSAQALPIAAVHVIICFAN